MNETLLSITTNAYRDAAITSIDHPQDERLFQVVAVNCWQYAKAMNAIKEMYEQCKPLGDSNVPKVERTKLLMKLFDRSSLKKVQQ